MFERKRRTLFAALAIAATCILWMRPLLWTFERGTPDSRDFAPLLAGAHCLFHPCNPYDSTMVEGFFHQVTGRGVFIVPEVPVYPPATFLAVSPLLLLPWPAMHLTWTLLSALSLLSVYVFWIVKFDLYTSVIAYLPILLLLQSGILFPALWVGQPVVLAVTSGALGIVLMISGSAPLWAGLLLGVSLVLKPQLVLAPALYLLCRQATRKQTLAALVLATAAFVAGTALLHGQLHSWSFFARESANMKLALEPGHLSDPSPANPDSSAFLNLQVPLYRIVPNLKLDGLIAYGIAGMLFVILAALTLGRPAFKERPYTIIAVLVFLSLLPAYHRGYDELLLLLVIPSFAELRSSQRTLYWLATGLSVVWIFNHRIVTYLSPRAGLFPYTPFVELALCVVLLASLRSAAPGGMRSRAAGFDQRQGSSRKSFSEQGLAGKALRKI